MYDTKKQTKHKFDKSLFTLVCLIPGTKNKRIKAGTILFRFYFIVINQNFLAPNFFFS